MPISARVTGLRLLNRVLPLGHRYAPLASRLIGSGGDVLIPSLGLNVVVPRVSIKDNMPLVLGGLNAAVPDFALVKDMIAGLTDGCILDVGANAGAWSLLCSKVSALPIVAFEPEPTSFSSLKQNLEVNAIKGVDPRNLACGSEDGPLDFHAGINGYTLLPGHHQFSRSDRDVLQVDCVRLDALRPQRKVAFVKIDVEGFEWHVLQGAAGIIERDRPGAIVEIHPPQLRDRGRSAEEVLSFLKTFYERIDLYLPRQRSASKIKNFIDGYRIADGHRQISETDFVRLATAANPPGQIYAVCRA